MNQRNKQIDIAKGLGILLVVFGHNQLINQEMANVIFSFHMPLFFFLSGLFFKPEQPLAVTVRARLDSLVKPYLVTLLLFGILFYIFRNIDVSNYIRGMLYGNGSTIYWQQMWFIPHLFMVSIFSWLFMGLVKTLKASNQVIYVGLVLLLITGVFSIDLFWLRELVLFEKLYTLPGLPLSTDIIMVTAFFFILGYVYTCQSGNFQPSLFLFLGSLILFVGCHYFFDRTIDLNMRRYDGLFVPTIEALTGIYITLSLAYIMQFQSNLAKVFSTIGSASLFILMFNGFIQGNAYSLLVKIIGNEGMLVNVAAFIAASIVPVIMWLVVKKIDVLALFFLPVKTNSLYARFARSAHQSVVRS